MPDTAGPTAPTLQAAMQNAHRHGRMGPSGPPQPARPVYTRHAVATYTLEGRERNDTIRSRQRPSAIADIGRATTSVAKSGCR